MFIITTLLFTSIWVQIRSFNKPLQVQVLRSMRALKCTVEFVCTFLFSFFLSTGARGNRKFGRRGKQRRRRRRGKRFASPFVRVARQDVFRVARPEVSANRRGGDRLRITAAAAAAAASTSAAVVTNTTAGCTATKTQIAVCGGGCVGVRWVSRPADNEEPVGRGPRSTQPVESVARGTGGAGRRRATRVRSPTVGELFRSPGSRRRAIHVSAVRCARR